jgi:hypothetical protein
MKSKQLLVNVTEEDTKTDSTNIVTDCMCARAITRATGRPVRIGVMSGTFLDGEEEKFLIPSDVANKICEWTTGKAPAPFKFQITYFKLIK